MCRLIHALLFYTGFWTTEGNVVDDDLSKVCGVSQALLFSLPIKQTISV